MSHILHGVGIPQTVLVAVVELLHLGERLQAEMEDRQGGTVWSLPGPPGLVGRSGLHCCCVVKGREGVTLTLTVTLFAGNLL